MPIPPRPTSRTIVYFPVETRLEGVGVGAVTEGASTVVPPESASGTSWVASWTLTSEAAADGLSSALQAGQRYLRAGSYPAPLQRLPQAVQERMVFSWVARARRTASGVAYPLTTSSSPRRGPGFSPARMASSW